jgi:pyridoxamine 5'-phosphate oxidase
MCSLERHDQYTRGALDEANTDKDPFQQFAAWFADVHATGAPEPNAMTVASSTPDGYPSARVALLKGFDERGFVFYTNYQSRKGRELEDNPRAALVFFWPTLERQVRVTGTVRHVSRDETDRYFRSRPRGSQLGAWASRQSTVVEGRAEVENRLTTLDAAYGEDVPTPPHWGGYRVVPDTFEFWQGRPNRLHDRLQYIREIDRGWRIERLSP